MKPFILFIYCFLVGIVFTAKAQDVSPKAQIAAIGRYQSGKVELRWIAQQASIIRQGFTHGYVISRKIKGKVDSVVFGKVLPYSQASFDSITQVEKDPELNALLGMAGEFIYAKGNKTALSFDKGIGELLDAKNNTEMQSLLLTLAVVKNKKMALAMGLAFEDPSAQKGLQYEYTITPLGKSTTYDLMAAKITLMAEDSPIDYQTSIQSFSEDKRITFVWPESKKVAGFFVERANNPQGPYQPLNNIPFYGNKGTGVSFSDDSVENYVWYHYQFYALNHFGDKVLIGSKLAMAVDKTPPSTPIMFQPKHIPAKQMEITWSFPETEKDLRGFVIGRSHKDTGSFSIIHNNILAANTRSFIDTGFNLYQNNYYVVYALDTAGNYSASTSAYALLIDSIAPAAPKIITASMDSLGVVKITLAAMVERDYMGYQLYRANAADHEFSLVSYRFEPTENPNQNKSILVFDTVSLNTLTPKVYYKIKALDHHYNSSVFSEVYAVSRIDTIAPTTPLIIDVFVSHQAVSLLFEPSKSIDIKEHILYRKLENESTYTPKVRFLGSPISYKDTLVQEGKTYLYCLQAKDASGNLSPLSNPVSARPYVNGVLAKVSQLKTTPTDTGVLLTWNYPMQTNIQFVVYKRNKNQQMEQYAVSETTSFLDKTIGGSNQYQVRVVRIDGAKSALSEMIEWNSKK